MLCMAPRDDERVHPESVEEWRDWLRAHADRGRGVWLVQWKRRTGRQAIPYEEQITEALAVGWIDSTAGTLDDERSMLWFAPRKRGSGWSRSNKRRLERLEREGRMTDRGRAVVAAAKADGSWTLLDDVEDLVVPDDLAAALDRVGVRPRWDALPPSTRKQHLGAIALAKRAETRARRVEHAVQRASPQEQGP
jgi:uncharacterized protein YdeI (YjbR/CyaY-like superfamily)